MIVQRERQPWRIEYRHVLEIDGRLFALAPLLIVVKLKFAGLRIPVTAVRLARRKGAVRQSELVFAFEIDPLGFAMPIRHRAPARRSLGGVLAERARQRKAGIPVVDSLLLLEILLGKGLVGRRLAAFRGLASKQEGRLLEIPDLVFETEPHLRPADQIFALFEANLAFRLHLVLNRPIGQPVRVENRAHLAQFGIPLGVEFAFDVAAHAISAQEHWPRFGAGLWQRRHCARVLERQRRPRIGDLLLIPRPRRRHLRRLRFGRPRAARRARNHGPALGRCRGAGPIDRRQSQQGRIDA